MRIESRTCVPNDFLCIETKGASPLIAQLFRYFFPSACSLDLIFNTRASKKRARTIHEYRLSITAQFMIYLSWCARARARAWHIYIRVRQWCDNAGRYPTHIMQFSAFIIFLRLQGYTRRGILRLASAFSLSIDRFDRLERITDTTRKESSSTISLGGKKLLGCLPRSER